MLAGVTSCHCCLDYNFNDLLDQAAEQTQSHSLEHVRDIPLAEKINWNSNDNCQDGDVHCISYQQHQPVGRTPRPSYLRNSKQWQKQ